MGKPKFCDKCKWSSSGPYRQDYDVCEDLICDNEQAWVFCLVTGFASQKCCGLRIGKQDGWTESKCGSEGHLFESKETTE